LGKHKRVVLVAGQVGSGGEKEEGAEKTSSNLLENPRGKGAVELVKKKKLKEKNRGGGGRREGKKKKKNSSKKRPWQNKKLVKR